MALNNIFKEPRREITESLVGLIPTAGYLWLDYRFAAWLETTPKSAPVPLPIGMLIGVLFTVVCIFGLMGGAAISHWIGESICDAMARRGLEIRPRRRL